MSPTPPNSLQIPTATPISIPNTRSNRVFIGALPLADVKLDPSACENRARFTKYDGQKPKNPVVAAFKTLMLPITAIVKAIDNIGWKSLPTMHHIDTPKYLPKATDGSEDIAKAKGSLYRALESGPIRIENKGREAVERSFYNSKTLCR
ncbi:MAG: hypothetical protein AAFN76_08595, partial [Pseudomonadota bacterium]